MHKTIYIEADEEITSIIDRVKKEGAPDIFIVVPKNAMLIQGVINLKLLKKESAKIKKNIILVTNDKQAKKVIGRIGFEIKEMLSLEEIENVSREDDRENLDEVDRASIESFDEIEQQEKSASHRREIGSASFFADEDGGIVVREDEEEVDDIFGDEISNTPEKVIKRMDMARNKEVLESEEKKIPVRKTMPQVSERKIAVAEEKRKKEVQEIFENDIDFDNEEFQGRFSDKKAEDFFNRNKKNDFPEGLFKKSRPTKKPVEKKTNYFLVGAMVVVLAIIGFGGWAYFNWPKMNIVVYPKEKKINSVADINVSADLSSSDIEKGELAGKMEEIEITKTLEFDATGEKYSSDQGKARGKVMIYNKYSSAPQSLVATTRILSKDGKLFRLIDSVIVPGMEGETPGKIEAKVSADKPGSSFNIEASSFTIEGFKGNPKYEKFEVVSADAMVGGSDNSDNKLVKYILGKDIDTARTGTLESLEKSFEDEIKKYIEDSRGYVLDSAKKEIIENKSSLDADDVTDKFNYTIKQKIRLMTFSEEDLLAVAEKSLKEKMDSGYEFDENEITTEIIKDVTDFEKKTLSLRLNVSGVVWPKIDRDNFKKGIANKNEEEFGDVLKKYQEIKKVDIGYNPGWLSGVPVSEQKIYIEEKRDIFDE